MSNKLKLSFTILLLTFVIVLGNIKGLNEMLFFKSFGTNVYISVSTEVIKPMHSESGTIAGFKLSNNKKIYVDNLNGVNFYYIDGETKLFETQNNEKLQFFGNGDKIYIIKRIYNEGRYIRDSISNSLVHEGDILYCYDICSRENREFYSSQKNEWIIFADDVGIVLFDDDEMKIVIKNIFTGETIYIEPLGDKLDNIYFEVFEECIKYKANQVDGTQRDGTLKQPESIRGRYYD